jgi:hypothetical protein
MLELEFGCAVGRAARRANSLEIEQVERDLKSGAFRAIVTDPAAVSRPFFSRLRQAVASTTVTLVLWTVFELDVLPAILSAGSADRVELFFRGDEGDAMVLRRWLRSHGRATARAVVLHTLAPTLQTLDPAFAHVVLGVLLGRFHERSIPALLAARRLHARQFERQLERAGLCRGRSLMHLGRLMTAYKCIAAKSEGVATAAAHAGYGSPRALRINAHRFIGSAPSAFSRLTPDAFASRIVRALER